GAGDDAELGLHLRDLLAEGFGLSRRADQVALGEDAEVVHALVEDLEGDRLAAPGDALAHFSEVDVGPHEHELDGDDDDRAHEHERETAGGRSAHAATWAPSRGGCARRSAPSRRAVPHPTSIDRPEEPLNR